MDVEKLTIEHGREYLLKLWIDSIKNGQIKPKTAFFSKNQEIVTSQ